MGFNSGFKGLNCSQNICEISDLIITPTNAQQFCFKTLQFTLNYITIAPTCFGFD